MKITPVLIVEDVEKSLVFWVERMGFTTAATMPDGDRIGFAMLLKDGAELMLQSIASVMKDEPKFAPDGSGKKSTVLFIEVEDLTETKANLEGYPILMPERVTFYGMREIGVSEPNGHTVIFAAKSV